MKQLLAVILFLLSYVGMAQKPPPNYGADSTGQKIAFNVLHSKYDFSIAYTTEGYWQSDRIHYLVISVKNGGYYKGNIKMTRSKNGIWSSPSATFKKVNPQKAQKIIDQLQQSGLWKLNADSLNNQTQKNPDGSTSKNTLSDATNYRFELITVDKVLIIESYAPEYFIELLPNHKQRESFIKTRDNFLRDYKTL